MSPMPHNTSYLDPPGVCVCVCHSRALTHQEANKKKRHIAATHPHKHTRVVQFVSAGHLAHALAGVRAHRMLCSSGDG